MNNIKEITNRLSTLINEMRAIEQPRSNYVLRHFVVAQHDTPMAQRKQILDELRSMMFFLADLNDDIKLAQLEKDEFIEKLNNESISDTERIRTEIFADKKSREITSNEMTLTGRMRECETLLAMLDEIPAFTREQYEAEQPLYWQKRITRQFRYGQMGDAGNLDAVRQMLTEVGTYSPIPPMTFEMIKGIVQNEPNDPNRNLPAGNGN